MDPETGPYLDHASHLIIAGNDGTNALRSVSTTLFIPIVTKLSNKHNKMIIMVLPQHIGPTHVQTLIMTRQNY